MSAPYEFLICAIGDDNEVGFNNDDHATFPVDHPLRSSEWNWYCSWVELAFMARRMVRSTDEQPDASWGSEPPAVAYPNLVLYREWLIENTPTAQFHGKMGGAGREWFKIEFTSHTDYVAHKLRWVGDESADCN